jgi:hypothetical protein
VLGKIQYTEKLQQEIPAAAISTTKYTQFASVRNFTRGLQVGARVQLFLCVCDCLTVLFSKLHGVATSCCSDGCLLSRQTRFDCCVRVPVKIYLGKRHSVRLNASYVATRNALYKHSCFLVGSEATSRD